MDNFLLFPPIFWKVVRWGGLFACLCNSSWMPFDRGPLKGCYSVTSTERTFSMRSETWWRRNIKTSFPNGCSGIFLVELIGGWSKKQDKTSKQTSDHQTNRSKAYMIYHEASVTSYVYEIRRRLEGLSTDVNECWPYKTTAPAIWSWSSVTCMTIPVNIC